MDDRDSSDFTFCKVSSGADGDNLDSPKAIPTMNITLEDNNFDDASTSKAKETVTDERSKQIDNTESPQASKQNGSVVQKNVGEAGQLVGGPSQSNSSIKKPTPRAKVPFEKGYSQMDWLRLTRTNPDLARLKGQSNRRLISLAEVKEHKSGDFIWTVLKGRVYNIAPYMKFHPGGVDMLTKAAGKDCTSLFNKYHAWVNAEFLLEKCLVGFLDPNQ